MANGLFVAQKAGPVFVAESAAMRAAVRDAERFGRTDMSIVVSGETGVGKEVVARIAHRASERFGGSFHVVHCGALPEALVENEFFGHVQGSYTSADRPSAGILREADGGTVFLDEIGELPLAAQVKLLRFLEDGTFRPIGAGKDVAVDVRVIAATNCDLAVAVRAGKFRRDLYYRLVEFVIHVPPLRERPEDIDPLTRHFLDEVRPAYRENSPLAPSVRELLRMHRWPGNVRELRNVMRRAFALAGNDDITIGEVIFVDDGGETKGAQTLQGVNREYFRGLLRKHRGNMSAVAREARVSRKSAYQRIERFGLADTWQAAKAKKS